MNNINPSPELDLQCLDTLGFYLQDLYTVSNTSVSNKERLSSLHEVRWYFNYLIQTLDDFEEKLNT